MKRTFIADHLNVVANHDDVRPWLGSAGPLDLSAVAANPANVLLQDEHGGFIFQNYGHGLYEIHTLFLVGGRGKHVRAALGVALEHMFTATDCNEIVTRIWNDNAPAKLLAAGSGFKFRFERARGYEDRPTRYYSLLLADWIMQTQRCADEGEAFHYALERSVAHEQHADDPVHDHYAGAASLMLKARQPQKAIYIYNRWAQWAGYEPVCLVSADPPCVDIKTALVTFLSDGFEVTTCPLQ